MGLDLLSTFTGYDSPLCAGLCILGPRENLDADLSCLTRYLLKCLEPVKVNSRPRAPKMMRLGERHNWEFNYRHAL